MQQRGCSSAAATAVDAKRTQPLGSQVAPLGHIKMWQRGFATATASVGCDCEKNTADSDCEENDDTILGGAACIARACQDVAGLSQGNAAVSGKTAVN